jgi:hypothetical protein
VNLADMKVDDDEFSIKRLYHALHPENAYTTKIPLRVAALSNIL